MSKGSLRPSVKQALHEPGALGVSLGASPDSTLITKKLIADKDTCINRENPLRKVGSSHNLVVGYDYKGNFDRAIRAGNTHGFWTLANANGVGELTPNAKAPDGGGFGRKSAYLARTLMQFDLNEAGLTRGNRVATCFLDLTISKSDTVDTADGITIDYHRFHAGNPVNVTGYGTTSEGKAYPATGATGIGDKGNWDDTATWYEWKWTGLHEAYLGTTGSNTISLTGPGTGPFGLADLRVYGATAFASTPAAYANVTGGTHGPGWAGEGYTALYPSHLGGVTYAWDLQGLGATGGGAPYAPSTVGQCTGSNQGVGDVGLLTNWSDFSDGASGSNSLENPNVCTNHYGKLPFSYIPEGKIRAGQKVRVDITSFAQEALHLYGGHMRIMVKVRDDWTFGVNDTNRERRFIVFHSREGLIVPNNITDEKGNPIKLANLMVSANDFAPSIDISYIP